MQSKKTSKILSLLMALSLVLAMLPATTAYAADPVPQTGDTVNFGTYEQANDGGDGESIAWKVLANAEGKLFLLSEKNLDVQPYHVDDEDVTWAESTIRSWLNGYDDNSNIGGASGIDYSGDGDNFINTAFTPDERASIVTTSVVNDSGADTADQVFLLSFGEVRNAAYGFTGNSNPTDMREALNTAYVASWPNMALENSADDWWLRSPGNTADYAAYVDVDGAVISPGTNVDDSGAIAIAVRPAINLKLDDVAFKSVTESVYSAILKSLVTPPAITPDSLPGGKVGTAYSQQLVATADPRVDVTWSVKPGDELPPGLTLGQDDGIVSGTPTMAGTFTFAISAANAGGSDTKSYTVLINPEEFISIDQFADDTVYFGTYEQANDGGDGEPIAWRVLDIDSQDGKLFLLAEKNLDAKPYHEDDETVTWERSTIRSWLNGYGADENDGGINYSGGSSASFIRTAFSAAERLSIAETTVANDDNPDHNTAGGEDTDDKVFLMSLAEVTDPAYGFTGNTEREAVNTAYVASVPEMEAEDSADDWWLRSPGHIDTWAAYVFDDGDVVSYGSEVNNDSVAARPALNLDLDAVFFTDIGGKIFAIPKSSRPTYPGVPLQDVLGAYRNAVAPPDASNGNQVTVNDTSTTTTDLEFVFGGYNTNPAGDSTGNSVTLNDGAIVNLFVFGGFAFSGGDARGNTVTFNAGATLTGVSVLPELASLSGSGSVFGGSTAGAGSSSDNKVIINTGAAVNGSIYGGMIDSAGATANDNTVTLYASVAVDGDVYGGCQNQDTPIGTGNTLKLIGAGQNVGGDLNGFQNLSFSLPADLTNGDTVLTVGGTVDITGATVSIDDSNLSLSADDTVVLIDASAGTLTGAPANTTLSGDGYGWTLSVSGNQLIATVGASAAPTYPVTVSGGTADLTEAAQGATVTLTAGAAPSGQRFKEWNISPAVTFVGGTSENSSTAQFTMPAQAVTAAAVYENIPAGSFTVTQAGTTYGQALPNPTYKNLPAGVSVASLDLFYTGALGDAASSSYGPTDAKPTEVGTYTVTATATPPSGPPVSASADFTIAPKPLTVSGLSVTTKVYDGTTAASFTGTPVLTGRINNDDVSADLNTASATFDTAEVGKNKNVTVAGIILAGAKAFNYSLPDPLPLTLKGVITALIGDAPPIYVLPPSAPGTAVLDKTVTDPLVQAAFMIYAVSQDTKLSTANMSFFDLTLTDGSNPVSVPPNEHVTVTLPYPNNKVADAYTRYTYKLLTYDAGTGQVTELTGLTPKAEGIEVSLSELGHFALAWTAVKTGPSGGGGGGGGGGGAQQPVVPPATPGTTVSKASLSYISGANRVLTSVAISRQGWTSAATVILAPGGPNNLIDALAVAPLAGQENAPILLCLGSLDPEVIAEIQRLGAKKVYAVGALSETVIEALKSALPGLTVETLRGANRFETAALINAKVQNPKGTFIVGYNAIADAVSAASFAAANAYTIQIANQDGSTSAAPGGGQVYILGGPTLVGDVAGATRLYGADRYATNKAIRAALTFEYTNIYTADGATLVDALTGSALAARTKAAIVLTPAGDPTGVDFGGITTETKVYAFGGAK
jgi:hypothetical protein